MTIRTIGRFEQHVEKVVLGGAIVAAATFAAGALFGEPNRVRDAGGAEVTPGRIDAQLEVEARLILSRLGGRAEIDLRSPWPVLPAFESALQAGVAPHPALELPVPTVPLPMDAPVGAVVFGVPQIQAPVAIGALAITDTLADGVVSEHPALAALVPAAPEPADLTVVVAAGIVDLAELRRSLQSSGVPDHWHRGRADRIVDVVLLRQELPGGGVQELDAIPGQLSLRGEIAAIASAAARDDILDRLDDPGTQLDIVQPDFYSTRHAALADPLEWIGPGAEAEGDGAKGGVPRELQRLVRQRHRLVLWLQEHCGVAWNGPEQGDGLPGEGGSSGGNPFSPDGEKGKRPKPDQPEVASCPPETIRRTTARLERLGRRIQELTALLPGVAADEAPSVAGDELAVWAYDLSARAGHSYRYAFRLRVCNPFFGRDRALVADQRHLAMPFTLDSPVSAWSDPIIVPALTRVWITRADAGPDLGRVTAEVHRYYDGQAWMERFSAVPGDAIGTSRLVEDPSGRAGRTRQVDFRSGLYVVDVVAGLDGGTPGSGGAVALIADITDGGRLGLRDPAVERGDPARDRPWRILGWPD